MPSSVLEEYNVLKSDQDRFDTLKTSSLTKGKRLYKLTTNIKTLKTYVTYIEELYNTTNFSESIKQKIIPLQNAKFKNPYDLANTEYIRRSDIVKKANNYFGDGNNPFVKIVVWLMLLKEEVEEGTSFIYDTNMTVLNLLPHYIKQNMYEYIRKIAPGQSFDANNPLLNSVVIFGDTELLSTYSKALMIGENISDFIMILNQEISNNDSTSPIYKRISGAQPSSFKEEAKYLFLFHILNETVKQIKFKNFINNIGFQDGENILYTFIDNLPLNEEEFPNWLFEVNNSKTISDFKDFIANTLDKDEREELIKCIAFTFNIAIKV